MVSSIDSFGDSWWFACRGNSHRLFLSHVAYLELVRTNIFSNLARDFLNLPSQADFGIFDLIVEADQVF